MNNEQNLNIAENQQLNIAGVSTSNIVLVEYQYHLGKVNGKVAYIMKWIDNNIGKHCNEKGWRGQIFFDRGEEIRAMEKRGYIIQFIN